jgi:energy-coupling factor transporter ATP-binding protein EcfA2
VAQSEPVLLVGETGSGKTTSVQELASLMQHTLVVQNISLSTDSSDLLGGFRPVSLRQLFLPSYEQFVCLFKDTFSQTQNSEYLHAVAAYFRKEQWKKLLKSFLKAAGMANRKLQQQLAAEANDANGVGAEGAAGTADAATAGANNNSTSSSNSSSTSRSRQQLVIDWSTFTLTTKRFEMNLPKIQVWMMHMYMYVCMYVCICMYCRVKVTPFFSNKKHAHRTCL